MKNETMKCRQCKKYCKRYEHLGICPPVKKAKNCLKNYKNERFAEFQQAFMSKEEEFSKDYHQRRNHQIKRKHRYNRASMIRSYGWVHTVQPTSVLTKASVWYEMRVLWANINQVKSHFIALAFNLQTDINQIFQMRYCLLS